MRIYAVNVSYGCFDDRTENTIVITENEEKAYSVLMKQNSDCNELEIWENGILISSYIRYYDNIRKVFGKWERNYGEVNEKLNEI
jgi:hypothetical protein